MPRHLSPFWLRSAVAVVALAFAAGEAGPLDGTVPLEEAVELGAPPRPARARSGSAFAKWAAGRRDTERQRAAVAELVAGNLPDSLRQLVPIRLAGQVGGRSAEAVVWVTPDYIAIGSDRDFLRMPLSYFSATEVANRFDCVLPTTRIVDAVFAQSPHHLRPEPLPPDPRMRSIEYFLRHRRLIEAQRAGIRPGELLTGHKKDVVLTNRLETHPDRIAIYGWHRPNGEPIQPLSTVHGARYADYSHGLRLVRSMVEIDGARRSIYEVLADPESAPLLSDEGVIAAAWNLMHPARPGKPAEQ